jgi:hypothetical protein
LKIQIHESHGPLLRGIGLTVVLLGTVLAAVQTREVQAKEYEKASAPAAAGDPIAKFSEVSYTNSLQDESVDQLTREVEELQDTVREETTVSEVLVNPWFGTFGTIGTAITAASFYAEWLCKRRKPVSQNPSP